MNSRGVVLWIVVILLLAAVWWLASERNERHYTLAQSGTQLVISRGRFFPTSTATLHDKPYEPVTIPQGEKLPFANEVEYDDQNALDRALFDILYAWAKKGGADAPALTERAMQLPGLTAAQLAELQSLRASQNFATAQDEIHQALKLIGSARARLQSVKDAGGEHSVEAAQNLQKLQQVIDQLAK